MQDQEVADALVFELRLGVVRLFERRIEIAARKQLHEPEDPGLDEEYGRGLERPEEAAGQPDGHDVLVPELVALPGGKPDRFRRIGERLAIEVLQQDDHRLVVAHESAAVNVAVAGAMLQRNAPLPARLARGHTRVGRWRLYFLAWNRSRPVQRRPVGPILKPGTERAPDQQPTKARAIDEQITRYRRAAFQADAFHESALAVLLHFDDLALDAPRAAALGVVAQVSRLHPRIELIGMDDVR